ncbi:MAG: methyltransferase domain-containing protein [Hyphomonadaceae bacterium]
MLVFASALQTGATPTGIAVRYDIERLQAFYASPLGRTAGAMIQRRVGALWPTLAGLDVLGVGHCDYLLDSYRADARRAISASPETQGSVRWPASGKCASTLVEEDRLPFMDAIFDRIVVCHALEEAESPTRLLREFWRVAAPEARILVIVAHRRGLWARAESTPFGQGRPYTRSQLYRLLQDGMFQPTASARALYGPPMAIGDWAACGETWEGLGRMVWPGFGGILMVEAVKRVIAEPASVVRTSRKTAKSQAPQPIQSPMKTPLKESSKEALDRNRR